MMYGDIITSRADGVTSTYLPLTDLIFNRGENQVAKNTVTKICSIDGCGSVSIARSLCNTHYRRHLRYGDVAFVKHIRGDDERRFWSHVRRTPSGCWEWASGSGYGITYVQGNQVRAHRYSYFLHHGRWPEPFCLHTCDNPPCVNPAHLYEGDQQDNMQDRTNRHRGHIPKGHVNGRAVLDNEQVLVIKRRLQNGATCVSIAKDFRVSRSAINSIKRGKNWKHVTD